MSAPRFVVLGAGPSGLGAALGLARAGFDVEVLEKQEGVGGNAGSFRLAGIPVDYGSHRLHPASDPEILAELRALLADDLLTRPRHGRIRLLGRWIHFPLRPVDLALHVHPRFALGVAFDLARKALPRRAAGEENFASVLEEGLGGTICREFYFPYARKIWGLAPEEISAAQAHKRVSSGTIGKMLRRLLPGGTGSGAGQSKGIFYYPRGGYGQISQCLYDAASAAGASVQLETAVLAVERRSDAGFEVRTEGAQGARVISADRLWSTIPAPVLVRLLNPPAPSEVRDAARQLSLRAMLLVYLVLETEHFTEYDAHYFPGADLAITRLSEPKNYADLAEPRNRTVLCAELPCSVGDEIWNSSDEALRELVCGNLERAELPVRCPIAEVATRRLPAAYPVYRTGYEQHFDLIDEWLDGIEGLLTFGRQGLFAHDNTHHTLAMARAAVSCLSPDGSFDSAAWADHRAVFETHVVED